MSKKGRKDKVSGAPPSGSGQIAPRRPSSHRLVVSLALVLFLPDLWLVMDQNLTVQTALVRFIAALLVSWIAAHLVLATVSSFPKSAAPPHADDTSSRPLP